MTYLSPKLREAAVYGDIDVTKVSHELFKSDVFSLGMTLLHLSLLDFPLQRENSFREDLDSMLQNLKTLYSEEWYRLVRRLLTYEESERPDFLLLEAELPLAQVVTAMTRLHKMHSVATYSQSDCFNRWNQPVFVKQLSCLNPQVLVKKQLESVHKYCHPNVCKLLDFVEESSPGGAQFTYMVFQQMKRSLQKDIENRASMALERIASYYSEDVLRSYLKQLVIVFAYFQNRHIAHGNINPHNIFIAADESLKVSNFAERMDAEYGDSYPTAAQYQSPLARNRLINAEAKHDAYKSDVNSLGLTMLHLTGLDESLMERMRREDNAEVAVRKCQQRLKKAGVCYTEEWFDILCLMLQNKEEDRPSFYDLHRKFTESACYSDDPEVLPVNFSEPLQITTRFGLKSARVSEAASESIPCIITLTAQAIGAPFSSADVVCLVDESGSMENERLDTVKRVLHHVVDKLTEGDRMCIIGFSDYAERKCPLVRCSEEGKRTLRDIVNRTENRDLTNIPEGLNLALKVLEKRRFKNPLAWILLISDGADNCKEEAKADCLEMVRTHSIEGLKVNCLGIGPGINVDLLQTLAANGQGEFHCIENYDLTSRSLEDFKWFSRVVARNISISVNPNPSSKVRCKVVKIYSSTPQFVISEMSINTKKDLLFVIETEPQPFSASVKCPPVKVDLMYTDHKGTNRTTFMLEMLKFIGWKDSSPPQEVSVMQDWMRAEAIHTIGQAKELVEKGQLEDAGRTVSDKIEEITSTLASTNSSLVNDVLRDMQRVSELVSDHQRWEERGSFEFNSISSRYAST